jgi:hypothetical protein
MYWRTIANGAPPQEAEKYEGDRRCPCMMAWLMWPVNSWRIRRAETPLRLLTSLETAPWAGS